MHRFMKYLLTTIALLTLIKAQDRPIEIKLLAGGQQQNEAKVASQGYGWNTGAQFNYLVNDNWAANFRFTFDYMKLEEDSVLLEWNWPYWDDRYIDWMLTGASPEEVDSINRIKEYWRPDSSYHGVFNPHQWVQELSFSLGLQYRYNFTDKLMGYVQTNLGFNLYERRLKMVENWTKTFNWEWDLEKIADSSYSEDEIWKYEQFMDLHNEDPKTYRLSYSDDSTMAHLTYDYQRDVTHFAPSKRGTRLFVAPNIGLRYSITNSLDLDLSYYGVWYLKGGIITDVEDIFKIDNESIKWFPFETKSMITLGITFRY